MAAARSDVRTAAARAARAIDQAGGLAPTHRTIGSWLASWVTGPGGLRGDFADGGTILVRELAQSAWDTSAVGIAWGLAHGQRPDPRPALDLAQQWSGPPSPDNAAARLAVLGQLVDAHDWPDHPARAAGYTVTNLALYLAGEGLGEIAGATEATTASARAAAAWREAAYARNPLSGGPLRERLLDIYGDDGAIGPNGWSLKGRLKSAGLPTQGKIRFVPPIGYRPQIPLHFTERGFRDRLGNIWVKGPSRTPGEPYEWDVQLSSAGQASVGYLSRDGKHLNVSMKGRITH